MTELSLYQAFRAICNLRTKSVEPGIGFPDKMRPAPHMEIIDTQKFICTALARLESDSRLLRQIAELNLKAVLNHITSGQPE